MIGFPIGWNPATGFGMPPEYMVSSAAGQASSSASQPANQQVNVSAPQLTQPQDSTLAPQPAVPNALAPQSTGPTNVSAAGPTPHQHNLTMLIQPKSPTEVLVSRFPHNNGVTWIFHNPANGSVHHVNVPYVYPVAQQQANQGSAQASTNNEMVLYQQPSNQITQQAMQRTSAVQPMAPPSPQPASTALPMASPSSQPAPAAGQ